MKQKAFKKKIPNIPLRRKIAILYARAMFLLKALVVCFCGLLFFTDYVDFIKIPVINEIQVLTAEAGFKLENVLISGQKNTKPKNVLASLNADTGTPIFSLNLKAIKSSLERNLWIKHAVVERKLPHTIHIYLSERTPIAIWQIRKELYLIDDEGFQITSEGIENFPLLLHVVGADANSYASKLIEDLSKHPEIQQKVLSAVRYGDRRWNLNLQQNITVKMPETNFMEALTYLMKLDKADKLLNQNYKAIDLRAADKYYIEKY